MARRVKVFFGDSGRAQKDRTRARTRIKKELRIMRDREEKRRARGSAARAEVEVQAVVLDRVQHSEIAAANIERERKQILQGVPEPKEVLQVAVPSSTISTSEISAIFNQEWSRVSAGINLQQFNDILDVLRLLRSSLIQFRNHVAGLGDADFEPFVKRIKDFFHSVPSVRIKEFVLPEVIRRAEELEEKKDSLGSSVRTSYDDLCKVVNNPMDGYGEKQFEAAKPIQEYKKEHGICCFNHFRELPLFSMVAGVVRIVLLHTALYFERGPLAELVKPFKQALGEFQTERQQRIELLKEKYLEVARQYKSAADEFARYEECSELCSKYSDFAHAWNRFSQLSESRAEERRHSLVNCLNKVDTLAGKGEEGKKNLEVRLNHLTRAVDKLHDLMEKELHTHRRALDVAYSFSLTQDRTVANEVDFVTCIVEMEEEMERLKVKSSIKKEGALAVRLGFVQRRVDGYNGVVDVLDNIRGASVSQPLVSNIEMVLTFIDVQTRFLADPDNTLSSVHAFARECGLDAAAPQNREEGVELLERLHLKLGIQSSGSSLFDWLIGRAISSQEDRVTVRWHQSIFEARGAFPEIGGLILPHGTKDIRWRDRRPESQPFSEFYYRAFDSVRGMPRTDITQRFLTDPSLVASVRDHTLKHVRGFGFESTGHLVRKGREVISLTEESDFLAKARKDPKSPLYENRLATAYSTRVRHVGVLSDLAHESNELQSDIVFYVYSTLLAIQKGHPFVQEHFLRDEGYRVPQLSFLLPLGKGKILCALLSLRLDLRWFTTFVTNWDMASRSDFFAPIPTNIFDLDL